ncbi:MULTISPECIES: hypothetical protein [unclassified Rhodococcus (in: high G+C Gram-positive bacteria)]|uniref:hypothetical protein n=1 Tax=unclassified Rhodococcus (in: high G+C Gram-positive bacteria) TaxID=192944 RepID=UPI00163DE1C4|nr:MULTISPECIES: hypothetical protein [unclassified Rhodococcus (in: high G+C Gram-positive bacteria)]MBC2644406.1 hypothetical protein [Rhodococcus sp. 3A]MBC2897902.1 hypothetical protein [Rhodococcus sp. 4CII]
MNNRFLRAASVASAAIVPLIAFGFGIASAAPPATVSGGVTVAYVTDAAQPEPIPGAAGQRCSGNRVGVDVNTGEDIVCVYSSDYYPDGKWVTAEIVGVHNIGEPCDPSIDRASQTPEGIPILCVQGQGWTPGP